MKNNKLISQACVKVKNSGGGSQDNQTWQTLCEYENQTLEAFVAASCLYAKFDCPVTRQNGRGQRPFSSLCVFPFAVFLSPR